MPSTSRAILVVGTLLASVSLSHAANKAAFDTETRDAMPDLKPVIMPSKPAGPAVVADGSAAPGKTMVARHRSRLARTTLRRVGQLMPSSVILRPSFATEPAASAVALQTPGAVEPALHAPSGNTEAGARTPGPPAAETPDGPREQGSGTVGDLLARHALANGVPLKLAQAVVRIESRGNARASNGGALGLMQIKYGTARAAGFGGPAVGLFVADTNLRYGMKILGEAYRAAGGDTCGALMRYQSGHLATRMSRANHAYCSRARAIMAGV